MKNIYTKELDTNLQKSVLGLLFVAVFFVSSASLAQATTYYVSTRGSDANVGTSVDAPFASIAKINSMTFTPGDTILFKGGNTFSGNLVFNDDVGSSSNPITIGSYGSGRATINAGTGTGIHVKDTGWLVIKDLIVKSPDRLTNTGDGILVENTLPGNTKLDYIRIDNVQVSRFGRYGVFVSGNAIDGSQSGFRDVEISNSVTFSNAHTGIRVEGYWDVSATDYGHENVSIRYNRSYNNPGIPGYQNHSGNGIILGGTDGGVIEHNVAYGNGSLNDFPSAGPVGIWAHASNNILIQYNESHHNKSKTYDGGGFDFDGGMTNSIIQYNYSHDNKGPGYLIYRYSGSPHTNGNLIARYNISQNDAKKSSYGAFHVAGTMHDNVYVHNNVVYMDSSIVGSKSRAMYTASDNVKVYNNIFLVKGGLYLAYGYDGNNTSYVRNNYWPLDGKYKFRWDSTDYTTLSDWINVTGFETLNGTTTALSVDPLLQNPGTEGDLDDTSLLSTLTGYTAMQTSPMIDNGLDLPSIFGIDVGNNDFYGNPIPHNGTYDIGVHEN